MSATSSPTQSVLYPGLLPVEPSAEPPPVSPITLENTRPQSEQPSLRKRASRAVRRFLIAFCIGVAATLACQSYGGAAREMIANSYPQLVWLALQPEPNPAEAVELVAPVSVDQQQLSLDLDAVRQSVDRIAASIAVIQEQMSRSTDRVASEQIAHNVARLAVGQEQMTREITKLQAVEQYVLYKSAEPPQRPIPVPMRSTVLRSSQAR
jgi:hypothetical protein